MISREFSEGVDQPRNAASGTPSSSRVAPDATQLGEKHLNQPFVAQQRVPLGEAEEPQDLLGSRVLAATPSLAVRSSDAAS
jgi:hypothetical protein